MKIFLTVSKTGLIKWPRLYKDCNKIVDELKKSGTSVVATYDKSYWKGTPFSKISSEVNVSEGKYKFVNDKAIKGAIFRSDAIIIEASYPSFRLGFESFFALSQQKPVLVLSRTRNYGKLIDQPNFFGDKYTDFTLPDIIEKFIRHVKKNKLRNRFNLFISDEHKKRLEDRAKRYGVSMSDYIRSLVEKDEGL